MNAETVAQDNLGRGILKTWLESLEPTSFVGTIGLPRRDNLASHRAGQVESVSELGSIGAHEFSGGIIVFGGERYSPEEIRFFHSRVRPPYPEPANWKPRMVVIYHGGPDSDVIDYAASLKAWGVGFSVIVSVG